MRLKQRIVAALQFMVFAFYPKTALIACTVFAAFVIVILAVVMAAVPENSVAYNIVFALTTGAAGSFFVSIIVELSNNYRHNMLAWHELQDYYSVVTDYEMEKQILMGHSPRQRAEKKAHDEFIAAGGVDDFDEDDAPKDIIQATWEQLPKIMPVLKKTLDEKKAFLSDEEINELKNLGADFHDVWNQIHMLLYESPILHNVLNHPDEEYPDYPKNVLEDMPDWIRKHIASIEGTKALKRLTDTILSDDFLLSQFMEEYDISQHGLESYKSPYDDEDYVGTDESEEIDWDEYDFSEPEDEEEFKALHNEQSHIMREENKPFVSWHLSQTCLNISESIDILERSILKKPYYSFRLKYDRDMVKESIGDPMSEMSYKSEKKRLEKLLKRQQRK